MISGFACLVCLCAATPPSTETPAKPVREGPVAKVNGDPIDRSEVDREFLIAFPDRAIPTEKRDALFAETRELLVKRRLVERWLTDTKQAASAGDVELAREQLVARLKQRSTSLDEFLRQQQLDEAGLRRSLGWQIGWGRYLDRQLTDSNIEKYFQKHRRDFDGTEVRLAHVLFKVDPPADPAGLAAARKRAQELAVRLREGSISFSEAARTYSDSPTRDMAGEIGWIGRREPMPESFARAAFALESQQISPPVETAFGVHLIQCLEIKPGQRRWQDVRAELEQAMTQYLFDWAANQVRAQSRIEYIDSAGP
jgi:parvulin-like peptidyl-prolyl isomerase